MFDFIYNNLNGIFLAVLGVIAFIGIGANIQDFNDQQRRRQRRSESARRGWATRRARAQ